MRWRAPALLCALAIGLLGAEGCERPGWVLDFEEDMITEDQALEASLDRLRARVGELGDDVSPEVRAEARRFSGRLSDRREGLEIILTSAGEYIDVSVHARKKKLRATAEQVHSDLDLIAAGRGMRLLAKAGARPSNMKQDAVLLSRDWFLEFGRALTTDERITVQVTRKKRPFMGVVGGLALFGLAVFAIWTAVTRRKHGARWTRRMLLGIVCAVTGVTLFGVTMARRAARGAVIIIHHRPCGAAFTAADAVLAGAPERFERGRVVPAIKAIGGLLACQAASNDLPDLTRARVLAADLRGRLGLEPACLGPKDCAIGSHCQLETGRCLTGCTADAACQTGVCHPADMTCRPSCAEGSCGEGARCDGGRCRPVPRSPLPWAPRGWAPLVACADLTCISGLDSGLARRIVDALGP